MQIKLPYGKEEIVLEIPEKNLLCVLKPQQVSSKIEIDTPVLQNNLKEFLANSKRILIIVNDYTRPTPTETIISMIEPVIKDYDLQFIVACGSHRAPIDDEFIQIFGRYYNIYKDRILVHDANDNAKLTFLGKTRRNTPVWLNSAIWEADKIISINSVEPHYFAGFTGGRKSFLPGVAGLETITANHKLSLQPQAKTLALEGNPVNEDMNEIAQMMPRDIFSVQVVIDDNHKLFSIRYGDIFESEKQAIEDAKKIFCVPIQEKADIVIALIQEPYDVNFYQSQKGMENAKLALKDKGIMIVASKCRKGVGDDEFIKTIASCQSPNDVIEKVAKDFKLGRHKSAKLAETMQWAEIWTVMPIDDNVVKSVFMTPFSDVNEALQKAIEKKGKDAKILILSDASLTVPLIC